MLLLQQQHQQRQLQLQQARAAPAKLHRRYNSQQLLPRLHTPPARPLPLPPAPHSTPPAPTYAFQLQAILAPVIPQAPTVTPTHTPSTPSALIPQGEAQSVSSLSSQSSCTTLSYSNASKQENFQPSMPAVPASSLSGASPTTVDLTSTPLGSFDEDKEGHSVVPYWFSNSANRIYYFFKSPLNT